MDVIGKAEHLKCLLVEWMKRMDGPKQYYSNNKYNLRVGSGDIAEVRKRRNWRLVDFWISDPQVLPFSEPTLKDASYVRTEYLYVGRTTEGTLSIRGLRVTGNDASYFTIGQIAKATVKKGGYIRLKLMFRSLLPVKWTYDNIDAYIEIQTSEGDRRVQILPEP